MLDTWYLSSLLPQQPKRDNQLSSIVSKACLNLLILSLFCYTDVLAPVVTCCSVAFKDLLSLGQLMNEFKQEVSTGILNSKVGT